MPSTQLSAFHPSPKRKRDHNPPFVPHVNTTLRNASTPPRGSPTPSGADSPRNAVADQLRGMTIAAISAIPMPLLTPTDDVAHKKQKLAWAREDGLEPDPLDGQDGTAAEEEEVETATSTPPGPKHRVPTFGLPQLQQRSGSPQQPRSYAAAVAFAQPPTCSATSQPAPSEPNIHEASSSQSINKSRPRPRKSPSPPPASLTWHDSEITGHLVDPTADPEDDGTGINGIGFRPTPAIAQARKHKREQAIKDYKMRQDKEARAKRMERRRRGVGGVGSASRESSLDRGALAREAEAARKAVVRFAI